VPPLKGKEMSRDEMVTVTGFRYVLSLGKQVGVTLFANGKGTWLPSSLVKLEPKNPGHLEEVTINLPQWLAEEKGMIYGRKKTN
jgi:hypothetical protein